MLAVWENGNNLIQMTEGGDKRTHRVGVFQVVKEFQFVEYTHGAAGDIDLLDSNIVGSGRLSSMTWRCPFAVLALVNVPAVLIFVVFKVFGFVYSGECTYENVISLRGCMHRANQSSMLTFSDAIDQSIPLVNPFKTFLKTYNVVCNRILNLLVAGINSTPAFLKRVPTFVQSFLCFLMLGLVFMD
jgi:hypothetical protein